MEYLFGTKGEVEILRTKGDTHTDLTGFHQIERAYPDQTITDNFHIVRKLKSEEDDDGNCYDWYEIDRHFRATEKARTEAEKAAESAAAIAFVVLSETGQIDDVTASVQSILFAAWEPDVAYTVGQLRKYEGKLYRCVQAHTSQDGWEPDKAASLWALTSDPAEEWPEWSQPVGAHDAYAEGAKVSHGGKHYISSVGGNVWEPGIYGWNEITE